MKIPSVATSDTGREYHLDKEREKKVKEEGVPERKRKREEAAEEKKKIDDDKKNSLKKRNWKKHNRML